MVYLFLQNWRTTLIPALAVPVSIIGTFIALAAFGFTINNVSLLAMVLAIGIVVDDAIVVGERIHAFERKGYSKAEAAVEGTMEVCVPVIFGVLTTIAAFLPILLLGGQMGTFFNAIGGVVVLCLFASLVESQLILPGHIAHRKTKGYLFESSFIVTKWQSFQGLSLIHI